MFNIIFIRNKLGVLFEILYKKGIQYIKSTKIKKLMILYNNNLNDD